MSKSEKNHQYYTIHYTLYTVYQFWPTLYIQELFMADISPYLFHVNR